MSLQYGLNITSSNMKKILEQNDIQQNGVRTWRQLFGNASLGHAAQSDALRSDYSSAIAEAYKANLAQKDAAINAGYNTGATREMIGATRNDLMSAYDTYIRNYSNAQSTIDANYMKEWSGIESDLTARSENFAKIYSSVYDYFSKELYGSTFGDGTDVLKDQGLDWLYAKDEQGNLTDQILSWDQAAHLMFNEDGSLNDQGTRFYDQMFNTIPQGWSRTDADGNIVQTRGFDKWLSDTNPELRGWWAGADIHNPNGGTNKGSVLGNLGISDEPWHNSKYGSLDNIYGNFNKIGIQFDHAHNTMSTMLNEYKNMQASLNANSSAAAHQNARAKQVEIEKSIPEYANFLEAGINKAVNSLKTEFGSSAYEKFRTEHQDLFNDYEKKLEEFKNTDIENLDNAMNNLNASWRKIQLAINESFDGRGYDYENSGYWLGQGKESTIMDKPMLTDENIKPATGESIITMNSRFRHVANTFDSGYNSFNDTLNELNDLKASLESYDVTSARSSSLVKKQNKIATLEKELKNNISKTVTSVEKAVDDIFDNVGARSYDRFYTENENLFNEYESILQELKRDLEFADADKTLSTMARLNLAWQKIQQKANSQYKDQAFNYSGNIDWNALATYQNEKAGPHAPLSPGDIDWNALATYQNERIGPQAPLSPVRKGTRRYGK